MLGFCDSLDRFHILKPFSSCVFTKGKNWVTLDGACLPWVKSSGKRSECWIIYVWETSEISLSSAEIHSNWELILLLNLCQVQIELQQTFLAFPWSSIWQFFFPLLTGSSQPSSVFSYFKKMIWWSLFTASVWNFCLYKHLETSHVSAAQHLQLHGKEECKRLSWKIIYIYAYIYVYLQVETGSLFF